jgi:hypothetical protein
VKDEEPPCGEENKVVVEGGVKDDVAVLFEGFYIPFVWKVAVYDYCCYLGVQVDVSVVVYPFSNVS